ncbi:glycosyltransferase family 2 protein [Ideonella sp. A 288]|uniref:glycosyltransferase family 2 protein n=1 Tax=Ideonella sp. A 288 TaxID=1962181 RepID=UPI000B4BC747|nr:glycosyltransferase family 2 protein [Ideonella sp. A 288]
MSADATAQPVDAGAPVPLPALPDPRISVVICNYNYARFIGAALDSVLSQSRPACQIVVVDDGSTDASVQVIGGYARHGVQLIVQANGGQVAAYNTGFSQADGDVVLFLDADDLLLPDALQQVAEGFAQGVAKLHFRLQLIGPQGEPLGTSIPSSLARGEVATRLLRHGVPHASPPASGNAYRRSVLQRLFPLPVDALDRHGADFFCIYGSTLFGTVAACERPLGLYRVHQFPRADSALNFGNAEQGQRLGDRLQARVVRFAGWVAERSGGTLSVPLRWVDFSIEKTAYATALLLDPAGRPGLRQAGPRLRDMLRAIWWRDGLSGPRKLGLMAWAAWLLVAPRPLALRAARYVCDPASRSARSAGVSP